MRKSIPAAALATLLAAAPLSAKASLITFDGLIDPGVAAQPIPVGVAYTIEGMLVGTSGNGTIANSPYAGLDNGGPFVFAPHFVMYYNKSDRCCRFKLHSFEYAAASANAIGETFELQLYNDVGNTFIPITLTNSFQKIVVPEAHYLGFNIYDPKNVLQTQKLVAVDNISFDVIDAPIPEPSSWLLMILGVGLTGAAARKHRPHLARASLTS